MKRSCMPVVAALLAAVAGIDRGARADVIAALADVTTNSSPPAAAPSRR